jgi:predicted transposase YdaD
MAKKIDNYINNPHDLFFKATISNPKAAQDLFKAYLSKDILDSIDLSTIRPAKASHVSPSLKELHSDLVFSFQIDKKPGFLIAEHQSSPDWNMLLRLTRYITEVLEHNIKGKKPRTLLPYVYTLCIFHNKLNKPYPYPTNFYDYFPNPELAKSCFSFVKLYLYNLSCCSDEELESHGTIGLMEKLFKYQGEKVFFEVLGKELERCRDWILGTPKLPAPLGAYYWKSILYYSSNVLDPIYISEEKLINLFEEKLFINKETIMRTIAQQIEKRGEKRGEIRGEKRGEERGIQKEKLEIAKSMLNKELAISLIQEVTGLSKETIEQTRKG